ncbi:Sec-independent protein translocase protein TatB [Dongia rigui]|uniref:Sec-independent protein translocase protein TatB n=1 Tax=Dongia rigui TaxID=940149 RepID=A0ABU5E1S5_9PROT|nr:Sec-independent protein translocase protein TatB [Dongia rigui]MDY0873312.1 Sec-independent protein translocase protein TatB [Dongia rigui]
MFDIGWSEMLIIGVVVLVVLGPKELPHALKTFSHWMRAARKLGSEFQSGVNEIVREAELEDAKRELQKISSHSISDKIEKAIDPSGDLKKAINEPVAETKAALSEPQAEAEPAPPNIADMTATMPSLAVTPEAAPAVAASETSADQPVQNTTDKSLSA